VQKSHYFAVGALVCAVALTGCAPGELRPPALPEMSQAELEAQAQIDLERARSFYLGGFPDAEVPVVERVRFISNSEWAETIAACLREEGFDVTTSPDGGMSSSPPEGQELPFALAQYTCNAKYPVNPRENVELNEDQIRYLYDYYTQVATPCLEELGFTDLPEPPSRQSYISAYPSGPTWNIYDTVADQADGDEWYEANEKCPQVPEGLYG
jgi:hypothetical protein